MHQNNRLSPPEDHLPLTAAVLQILLALSKAPLHGYGILQDVAARSDRPTLLPGTLYRALARLQQEGLVEPAEPAEGSDFDPRRRCYQLTELGIRVLRCELRRLEEEVRIGRERLARGSTPA